MLTMTSIMRGALAASLILAVSGVALAAEKTATTKLNNSKVTGALTSTTGTVGPTTGGGTTGGTVNLNSSDCKLLLGGTVVAVYDGRCGASGAYCKSSQGSACLTEK
jgi:hypothetical protein